MKQSAAYLMAPKIAAPKGKGKKTKKSESKASAKTDSKANAKASAKAVVSIDTVSKKSKEMQLDAVNSEDKAAITGEVIQKKAS